MSQFLTAALQKRNSNKNVDYSLNLQDFICQCYVNLSPNSYGMHIEEYLRRAINATNILASKEMGDFMVGEKYFEVKASYLSQNGDAFNMTHLRTWQKFNYYLCCFIDCDNDFKINFYVIDKNILAKMKLGFMNGTPTSNVDNLNVEMRATVKKDGDNHKVICKHNLLKDTTFESLQEFISEIEKNSN